MPQRRTSAVLPRTAAGLAGAALMATGLSACYSYVPPEPPGPVAGDEVRVELTGAAQDRLRSETALDLTRLEGRLVEGGASGGDLAVQIRLDANRLGFGSEDYVDTVRVRGQDVRSLDVKTLSKGRSVLAAVGSVAVLAGAYAAFGTGGGAPDDDGGNGGEFILVPLSRLLGWIGPALR